MIQDQITQADIERLLIENVLAAEQLRRIVAERLVAELRAEKDQRNGIGRDVAEVDALIDSAVSEG